MNVVLATPFYTKISLWAIFYPAWVAHFILQSIKKPGQVILTAKYRNSGFYGLPVSYLIMTVTNGEQEIIPSAPDPTPVVKTLATMLFANDQLQLSVTDDLADNASMTWTSSDNAIATVDENGKVTTLSPGLVTINVQNSDNTFQQSTVLRVISLVAPQKPVISKIEQNDSSVTIVTEEALVSAQFAISTSTETESLEWQSSNVFLALTPGMTYYAFVKDASGTISEAFSFVKEVPPPSPIPIVQAVNFKELGAEIVATDDVGIVQYGLSATPDPTVATWKKSNIFANIKDGAVYYAFAKDADGNISKPFPFSKP